MIDRIVALNHAVLLAEGWRRRLIALVAGAAGALALTPLGLMPALAPSLMVAVWLIDGGEEGTSRLATAALRAAVRDGWWFGFGYFVAGLWWIGAAFLVETDEFAWAMPLGILGLPAGLALFFALAFGLARLLWMPGAGRILALAFGITAAEYLRGVLFTGFPWNTYGQALAAWLVPAQAAALVGAEGLTLLAVLIFAAPATLADLSARPWRPTLLAALGLAALLGFGTGRLMMAGGLRPAETTAEMVPGVRLRLVQPNMSQREKIAQTDGLAVLTRLFQLSDRSAGPKANGMADATHVFWPESPFPFLLTSEPRALAEVARLLPARTTLVTGSVRREGTRPQDHRYFNSMQVFADKGLLQGTYDKQHLVPFGEYLPLEGLLKALGLRKFVHVPGEFSVSERRTLMTIPGLPPVLPLICYEAIFPHEIEAANPRPGLIVNVTNDAWFGETFGPHQHLAQARLRAIETGLPLVRAANTGISAVIDPFGRTLASIPIGVENVADVGLPKAIDTTIYAQHRSKITLCVVFIPFLLAIAIQIVSTWRNRRRSVRRQ